MAGPARMNLGRHYAFTVVVKYHDVLMIVPTMMLICENAKVHVH